MMLTRATPFTKEEITQLRERFDIYIKTVIDIDNNTSNEIQSPEIKKTYDSLTKHFFKEIYE